MDEESKQIAARLAECVSAISGKQALIFELLAAKLPLSDDEKHKLSLSAQQMYERAHEMNLYTQALRQSP